MAPSDDAFHERGATGVLYQPVKWLVGVLLLVATLIVMAWMIDALMVFQVWPGGLQQLRALLDAELARMQALARMAGYAPDYVTTIANGLYATVFKITGLHGMALRFADATSLSIPDTIVRNTYLATHAWIEVAMVGTQLLGVRLAALTMAWPAFALPYCVALADGWMQRAIRRAGGGRESASLYHRGKHLQLVLATLGVAAHLLLPVSVEPRWIWFATALLLAALAQVQWTYYKKHL